MKRALVAAVVVLVLLVTGSVRADKENKQPGDQAARVMLKDIPLPKGLAPPETEIKGPFTNGPGECVGQVACIKGHSCLIYRKYSRSAFRARPGMPLFAGDVLITGVRSRMQVKLIGEAVSVLEPDTWLEFNEVRYDDLVGQRRIYLYLDFGRAKFSVGKLKGSREGDFQVHTPTGAVSTKTRSAEFMIRVLPRTNHTVNRDAQTRPFWAIWFEPRAALADTVLQDPLVTVLLTGPGTQMYFSGAEGPDVLLWEQMVSFAIQGFGATRAKSVDPDLVKKIMTCHCGENDDPNEP